MIGARIEPRHAVSKCQTQSAGRHTGTERISVSQCEGDQVSLIIGRTDVNGACLVVGSQLMVEDLSLIDCGGNSRG